MDKDSENVALVNELAASLRECLEILKEEGHSTNYRPQVKAAKDVLARVQEGVNGKTVPTTGS